MDWELIIAVNLMMVSFLVLVFGLMNRHNADGTMLALHAAVIIAGGLAIYYGYAHAGTLTAAIFVPFILAPGLLLSVSTRAQAMAQSGRAARYARYAALIQPTRQMRFRSGFLAALAHADTVDSVRALEALKPIATPAQLTSLDITIARLRGTWDDVVRLASDPARDTRGQQEAILRALGELGQVDEMVEVYQRSKSQLMGNALFNAQLFLLAYGGRKDGVDLLLASKQGRMHPDYRAYWQGVAAFNAPGFRDVGRAKLAHLAAEAPITILREAAARYVAAADALPPVSLSPAAAAGIDAIIRRWQDNKPLRTARLKSSPVTLVLLCANAIMFGLEHWYGGVDNPEALFRLGALWPELVFEGGEWWRVVAAMFLHFGWAHFLMNMASLAIFGRMVEAAYGSSRMALIYGLGGLASMACVLVMMRTGTIEAGFLVGASGAIMALFGAWAGRLIVIWRRSRDVLDRQPAVLMVIIMAVQCAVDLSVPQISFTGHISGFAAGFVLGLAFMRVVAPVASPSGSRGVEEQV